MKSNAKRKIFINNMITYGMVVAAYIIMQVLVGTGHISSLMKGLLVPFCIYVIMAVSLNLTVGILGELSLGHAGFMCVGAFFQRSIFSGGCRFYPAGSALYPCDPCRRSSCSTVRCDHRYPGTSSPW